MRKYNCLIVDDEPPAREVLRRYVAQVPMLHLVGECSNAIQALTAMKQQEVDLLFLDIQMPQLSGIDLIGTLSQPPKIILTTAFEQYAIQAFELDVRLSD
ncbi:response regulator [Mucilaginibacter sp. JRF]|uniref:LytR/AlgR family response regulator transcription factor n=1 Tax=Mucilaginibacter sp. JRF TaxID=2780088 RepID=UPI001D16CFFF|nr:response regulator [Mucilaginibacter sp. JRF]